MMKRAVGAGWALCASLAALPLANAQTGYVPDAYQPSERGSRWFVLDSLDFRGQNRLALGVVGAYGWRPLRVYRADGALDRAVVREQWTAHVGASWVLLERLRLAVNVPIALSATGRATMGAAAVPAPTRDAALGDVRVGADVRLFGQDGDAVTGALGAQLYLPTGSPAAYSGDGETRARPRFQLAGTGGPFVWAASTGVHVRSRRGAFAETRLGSEVFGSLGAGLELLDRRAHLGVELYGHQGLLDAPRSFALEALLGASAQVLGDLRVGLAGAVGLTKGYGAASARALAMLEWAPGPRAPAPPPAPDPCVVDPRAHGCPGAEPPPAPAPPPPEAPVRVEPADQDKDGIEDDKDACPAEAGPADADPKKNGCPKVFLQGTALVISDQVRFGTNSAAVPAGADGDGVLQAVLAFLSAHPEIARLRVEGHTDASGNAEKNRKLSADRAAAVVKWLVAHGVAAGRLTSLGVGPDRPLQDNGTDAGRAANRRVEFHVEP